MTGKKLMTEFHWRHPRFTYGAYRPFIKHLERIRKFKETVDLNYIYKRELGKACFVHDVYAD